MTDYVPVPCARYASYELAILHRRTLRLVWADGKLLHHAVLRPLDLQTRDGEEFLLCRGPEGGLLSIRLDRIRRALPA